MRFKGTSVVITGGISGTELADIGPFLREETPGIEGTIAPEYLR